MTGPLRLAEFGIALGGLFFMSGTLTSYLTPLGSETAPMVQLIGGLLGLYAGIVLLFQRHAVARILGLYWPAVLPVLMAVMSLAWSQDIALTVRRAGALSLTTAFAFWLVFRFTPEQIFKLVVTMAVTIIVVNFAVIQVDPIRGIHQAFDPINAEHAGSWRGLFGHKNDFGRLTALCTAILVMGFVFGTDHRRLRWLMLPLIGLAVVMIAKSNSSQAEMLAAAVPTTVAVLLMMRRMTPKKRTMMLFIAIPLVVISLLSAQLIFEYMLGLLGRDATLTGRTTIWNGVLLAMQGNAVLGGGYGAGWQIVGARLTALTGIDVGHAHNGFLDLAVDIGFLGMLLTLMLLIWLGVLAFRSLMQGVRPEIATLALAVVIFSLLGNWVGSFLLLHNSLYWVLPVVTFAKLRDAPYADYQGNLDRRQRAGQFYRSSPAQGAT